MWKNVLPQKALDGKRKLGKLDEVLFRTKVYCCSFNVASTPAQVGSQLGHN